jgi:hypothetical protein
MNTLLLELAKRNAMAEILKLGNPYSSMLSVLQGSPEYQAQIEAAKRTAGIPLIPLEKAAERSVTEPSDIRIKGVEQALIGAREQSTAATAPQKLAPTEQVYYPPGSVGATTIQSARMRGQTLPDNVAIQPDGGVRVSGGGVTTGQIDQTQKDFLAQKDEAASAREGLYKAQLLREQLHQIGTSGPLTESLGALGALAQQVGVSEDTVKKYLSVRPASVEAAEKLSQDLLGEVLKATFPQRITNADITAWKNTVPRGSMLQDAYDLLLDKTIMPKFERAISRYGAVAALPATDPQLQTYTQKLEEFDKANPMDKFVGTYIYGQGALAGHRLRLIGNQWVDTATGKPVQ